MVQNAFSKTSTEPVSQPMIDANVSPTTDAAPTFVEPCTDPYNAYPKVYQKYEPDQNAEIRVIPLPEITEDALANREQAFGKMMLELVLAPCGVMNDIAYRGYIGYGLAVRAEQAAKQIQFTPAIKDGVEVPQRYVIEYEFYACAEQEICSRVREVVEGV